MPLSSELYASYCGACTDLPAHVLLLDLDAFGGNVDWVIEHARDKNIRIATKSMRCVSAMKRVAECSKKFQGWMTYSLEEAMWLRDQGFVDLLMGYPCVDEALIGRFSKNPAHITLMVDRVEHLFLLEKIAQTNQIIFDCCVDVDMSTDLPFLRFGVYRSSIRCEKTLQTFLDTFKTCSHLRLVGMMGYEAQIAGLGDKQSRLIRWLKRWSWHEVLQRRARLLSLIKKNGHELRFVNSGGSGSLVESSQDALITEVTVGSAFYGPTLFDAYTNFSLQPAIFYRTQVVRKPTIDIATLMGGGYIASGEIGASKQPTLWLPNGLRAIKTEGFGEVQTPVRHNHEQFITIGDSIFLRPAKAGEICEHFKEMYWIHDGRVVNCVSTYRGQAQCFI